MIKIIPLGGIGHVTNNMFVYEYHNGSQVERLIVDCGIGFPEDEMLGADLLVPDVSYLKGKENTIAGIVLTHGHDDHIAALPYILPQLPGDYPIYASSLTTGFAQADLKEFGINKKIQEFPEFDPLHLGSFVIDPIIITHSVPDTRHLIIATPEDTIYHGSDFKLDWNPVDKVRPDLQKVAYYGSRGVDCLLIDCLRVESEGYSLSETKVGEQLNSEIRGVEGRVIFTTMSSNIHRVQQIINESIAHGRQVAFIGRSIEENVKIAQQLGFLNIPDKTIVHKKRINKLNPKKICVIVAGSQGQVGSTLTRIASGEHTLLQFKDKDHIIFSADPIPGNENNVYKVIDQISQTGATISYRDVQDGLHVSGHASADEQRMMLSIINPKTVIPIGGTIRHMNQFRILARGMGMAEHEIITPKEGEVIAVNDSKTFIDNRIKLKTVIVDGLGIGDVGPAVLSDRHKMSQSGMVVIAVPVSGQSNTVIGKPEVITRGFVYAKHSRNIIQDIAQEASQKIPPGTVITDWKTLRDEISAHIQKYIFSQTQREPLILVVMVKS
jgi:ribonuclease J